MSQVPKNRQLSSRSIESLNIDKQELIDFIRERRRYMLEQEALIDKIINDGNNNILQLTSEVDSLKTEIHSLRVEKISIEKYRDETMFLIVTSQPNI